MNDYKIQHLINELFRLLGCPEKLSDEGFYNSLSEILIKSNTPYVPSKSVSMATAKKLSEVSPFPEACIQKIEELRSRPCQELDSFMRLLSNVQNDDKVKNMLKRDASHKAINGRAHTEVNGHHSRKESHLLEDSSSRRHSKKSISEILNIALLPKWVRERPNLSWNFLYHDRVDFVKSGPICVLPHNVQESRLIDDVLMCLVGIDGDYIYSDLAQHRVKKFVIDDSALVSMRTCVKQFVPVFGYYSTTITFIEENMHFEKGLVNHALAAAMRQFIKNYLALVSQLENQHLQRNLTLQKLWFYMQQSIDTMEAIANIASILAKGNVFGGAVLSVLHENAKSLPNSNKQEICLALTRAAAIPYFEMLEKWIYKGIILDTYSEFLVEDCGESSLPQNLLNEGLWGKNYIVRREQVPSFLEKVVDTIIATGKYLNAIAQCGKIVNFPYAKSIAYTMRENHYLEAIEPAYQFASQKLLDVLIEDGDLYGRLASVKHYFLLDHADFVVQFLDMAEEELNKHTKDIMPNRLESLLELALRTSSVNDDKYKDDLGIAMATGSIKKNLMKIINTGSLPSPSAEPVSAIETFTGLELLTFKYSVSWPLSLVLNYKAFRYYQIFFRLLFRLKYTERALCRVWLLIRQSKSLPCQQSAHFLSAFALCQRMLHYIQNLNYYFTLEVIEPSWNDLMAQIAQAHNVDKLMQYHESFLNNLIQLSMLCYKDLLKNMSALIKLCGQFSTYMQVMLKTTDYASILGDSMLYSLTEEQPFTDIASMPATLESFSEEIASLDHKFDCELRNMFDILNRLKGSRNSPSVIGMLCRLNFNHYYEEEENIFASDSRDD